MADNRFSMILIQPWPDDPLPQLPRFMANDCILGVCVPAEAKEKGLELLRGWGARYVTTVYWMDFKKQSKYWYRGVREILLGTIGAAKIPYSDCRPAIWAQYTTQHSPTPQFNAVFTAIAGRRPTLLVGDWRVQTRIQPPGWREAASPAALEALRKELLKSA